MLAADIYSDTLAGILFVYFIIWLISALIWGFIVRKVAENRGYYNDNSFWWGFFLGLIGLIVILTRPERRTYSGYSQYSAPSASSTQTGAWICPNCGTQNRLSNTCITCAKQRPGPRGGTEGWRCRCGRTNASYVGTCSCGLLKPMPGAAPSNVPAPQTNVQTSSSAPVTNVNSSDVKAGSKFDEVKSYKELLDAGIISQEDFDKKKAELLGL